MTESLFQIVVETSWRASWLIAAVLVLQVCFRRHLSPRVFYWLSLALVVRLLVPFALPVRWSPFGTKAPNTASAASLSPTVRETPRPAAAATIERQELAPRTSARVYSGWWLASVGWVAGVVALLAARAVVARRFVCRVRRSGQIAPEVLLAEARRQFGSTAVRVTVTDAVSTPALLGVFRPHLLFPPGLAEALTAEELRLIVAHERAHHSRRDLVNLRVAQVAAAIHWFNPLAWLVARQVRRDCEAACDDSVLARLETSARDQYGHTLLRTLSFTPGVRTPRFALGVVESKQQLKRRIQMIAAPNPVSRRRTVLVCAAAVACVVVSITRSSLAQPTVTSPDGKTIRRVSTEQAIDPAADGLDQQFPTGVVATIGQQTITVADIRREIAPLLPPMRRSAKSTEEYYDHVRQLKNSVIKDLIERQLLIKDFRTPAAGQEGRIAPEEVDRAVADRIRQQFGDDRTKLLEYLNGRGLTLDDYRRLVEEDIIYSTMRKHERALQDERKAAAAKAADRTGKVHLRLIQLARNDRTDEALQEQAGIVLARFRNGERFEDLAKELSVDARRAKGGDWGWLGEKDFRPEFWSYVQPLQRGQVSVPVIMKEGCFLLFVEERG